MTTPPGNLITPQNREQIKVTAQRIGRTVTSAINLARQGKLVAQRDASGRWWSSRPAAEAFMRGQLPEDFEQQDITDAEVRRARQALLPRRRSKSAAPRGVGGGAPAGRDTFSTHAQPAPHGVVHSR